MTTRKNISNLLPNTNYVIRIRARGSDGMSEWTRPLVFTTISDIVPPAAPTSVTWVTAGDSFHAEWDSVTENENGEEIAVTRYEIELVSGATTKIVSVAPVQAGVKNTFDLSFEANRALFGTPKASITLRVRAVDNKELLGNWSSPAVTATNAAPAAPATLTGVGGPSFISLKWDAVADTDLVGYKLYVGSTSGFTPGPTNLVYQGDGTGFVYQTTTFTPLFFKVSAVDKFGQESSYATSSSVSAQSPFTTDTTAPNVPSISSATITNNANGVGARATLTWTLSSPPSDLAGFHIRYRKVGDTAYTTIAVGPDNNGTAGTYTYQVELQAAYTNYEFQIRAFDWQNNNSAFTATTTATSAGAGVPAQVTGLTSVVEPGGLRYSWTANSETNLRNYELQIATNSGFTTGVQTFNTGLSTALSINALSQNTQYFARVRAVNVSGTAGAYSSTDTKTTGTYNGVVTAISADIITPGTLGTAGSGIINIGSGATLRMNGGALVSNTYGGTTYNASATSGFFIDDTHVHIPQGQISANTLNIGGTISSGNIILGGTGTIQTSGYTGTSGFRLSASGLEIPDGTLTASKIILQNGQNIMPPIYSDFEANPGIYSSGECITIIQGGNITITTEAPGRVGSRSLHVQWGTTATNPIIHLGPDSVSYNIPVESGKTYIFSLYAWCRGSVSTNLQLNVKWSDGTSATFSGPGQAVTTTLASGGNLSTATRMSGYATVPPGVRSAAIYFQSSTQTSGGSFNIDGIQVEEKTSSGTAPSTWRPGTSTTISGDQIRTGSIRSNNTAIVTHIVDGVVENVEDPEGRPAWEIDVDGDATFSNLQIRGNIVVGQPDLDDPDEYESTIASANYVPGSTGWAIRSDGFAEFQEMASNSIRVEALKSGNMDSTIDLDGSLVAKGAGGWVWMDNTGFYSQAYLSGQDTNLSPQGEYYIKFPNDGAPNIVSGKLKATTLEALGSLTDPNTFAIIMSNQSVMNPGATLVAQSSIQPPSEPVATIGWKDAPITTVAGVSYAGLSFTSSVSYRTAMFRANAQQTYTVSGTFTTQTNYRQLYVQHNNPDAAGAITSNLPIGMIATYIRGTNNVGEWQPATTGSFTPLGVVRLESAGQYAVLYRSGLSGAQTRAEGVYVAIFDVTSGSWIAGGSDNYYHFQSLPPSPSGAGEYGRLMNTAGSSVWAIAPDYINNRFLFSYLDGSGNLVVKYLNVNTGTGFVTASALTTIPAGNAGISNSVAVIYYGNADFGSAKLVLREATGRRHTVYSLSGSTATYEPQWSWPFPTTSTVNSYSAYDPFSGRFRQLDTTRWRLVEYAPLGDGTGTAWGNSGSTQALTKNFDVKATYYDDTASPSPIYQTAPSPATTVLVSNRSRLTVSISRIPYNGVPSDASPNKGRIYIDKGQIGTYMLAGTIVQPDTTILLDGGTWPGGATIPTTSTFPTGGAAKIKSFGGLGGNPIWEFSGDGSWRLGPFIGNADGTIGDGWHVVGNAGEPAFGSVNWTSRSGWGPVAFRRDGNKVCLQGLVNVGGGGIAAGGSSATPIFTLPAGYRPGSTAGKQFIGVASGSGPGFVILFVNSNGAITLSYTSVALPSGTWFSLDGITFVAEA